MKRIVDTDRAGPGITDTDAAPAPDPCRSMLAAYLESSAQTLLAAIRLYVVRAGVASGPEVTPAALEVLQETAADGLHALRASDGASLWTSPRVLLLGAADGLVFVGTTRLGPAFPGSSVSNIDAGNIEALRAGDGKVLWTQPTAGRAAHSAAISAGRMFVTLDGSDTIVEALDAMDGHLLWTQPLPLGGGETVLAVDQRFLYLVGPRTCALAPGDGATLWCSKISLTGGVVETGGNIISFAVHNPQVPGSSRLGVVALHAADGGSAWTWNIPSASLPGPNNSSGFSVGNYDPGLAIGDDAIYVAPAGGVYALRASDGHLLWHSQPQDDVMSLATGA